MRRPRVAGGRVHTAGRSDGARTGSVHASRSITSSAAHDQRLVVRPVEATETDCWLRTGTPQLPLLCCGLQRWCALMFQWLWSESKSATTTIILLILATILSVRGAYAEPMQLVVNGQARAFLLERPIAQGPRPTI